MRYKFILQRRSWCFGAVILAGVVVTAAAGLQVLRWLSEAQQSRPHGPAVVFYLQQGSIGRYEHAGGPLTPCAHVLALNTSTRSIWIQGTNMDPVYLIRQRHADGIWQDSLVNGGLFYDGTSRAWAQLRPGELVAWGVSLCDDATDVQFGLVTRASQAGPVEWIRSEPYPISERHGLRFIDSPGRPHEASGSRALPLAEESIEE